MNAKLDYSQILGPVMLSVIVVPALAQGAAERTSPVDNVTIIGHQQKAEDIAGSAHVIDNEELSLLLHGDVMRVLRTVPGVYLQEEEGFGLRPNIGIRGSGLDRSARIALLEDGVLIAPAPYSAPSAYYFPTQRRMHAVEVLKGPSAIAVGPRTTGGAVNLISTPIPDEFGGNVDLRIGQHNALDAHISVGDRGDRFSWLVETVQAKNDGFKTIDGPLGADMGPTGFEIRDYLVKMEIDSDPGANLYQSLRLKAGYTEQISDETYLGLTDADFVVNPYRRYAASAGDLFESDHHQLQLSYVLESDADWRGELTAYRNDFARNWFKLQSVDGAGLSSVLEDPESFATELSFLRGANSPADAIAKRHNNRSYLAQGLQGAVTWDLQYGDAAIALTMGGRIHEDEEDRLQKEDGYRMQDMVLVPTSSGAVGSQANRLSTATARSGFVDARIGFGDLTLTPGLRYEQIELVRNDFSTADPDRTQGPTRVRSNTVSVWIPGMGALYQLTDQWRLLGSVSKGFNPPAPGSSSTEESSINFEAGARYADDRMRFEGIYFFNDYDNLVGTVTESTGGGGEIGDQYDGGKVVVQGLELSAGGGWSGIGTSSFDLPMSIKYTWTAQAEFQSAFASNFDPWGDVQIGDELPYIPEHQLRATASIVNQSLSFTLAATYVGQMRAVAGQGAVAGDESIDAHLVWDALASVRLSEAFSAYLKVDNLMDETYVASRRPAGLRPGLERSAYAGVIFGF